MSTESLEPELEVPFLRGDTLRMECVLQEFPR